MSEKKIHEKKVTFSDKKEFSSNNSQNHSQNEDWPDSMPVWLSEKYAKDGFGPATYHEACRLKEEWYNLHGITENSRNMVGKINQDMWTSCTTKKKNKGKIECDCACSDNN